MSIIKINDQYETTKNNLLKQSFQQQLTFRMTKNYSYSTTKQLRQKKSKHDNPILKKFHEQFSQWQQSPEQDFLNNQGLNRAKSFLPQMSSTKVSSSLNKNKHKYSLQQLSKQLMKYQNDPGQYSSRYKNTKQFQYQGELPPSQITKFRLTFLRQLSYAKFNKKRNKLQQQKQFKQKRIEKQQAKKVNLKLQFPPKYQKLRQQSQSRYHSGIKFQELNTKGFNIVEHMIKKGQIPGPRLNPQNKIENGDNLNLQKQISNEKQNLLIQKTSRALIPSIKKLVKTSPASKKQSVGITSMGQKYKSQHIFLPKKTQANALYSPTSSTPQKKNFIEYIQQKQLQKEKQQRQRKIKVSRVQRKLPLNFLNYSKKAKQQFNKSLGTNSEQYESKSQNSLMLQNGKNQLIKGSSFYMSPRSQKYNKNCMIKTKINNIQDFEIFQNNSSKQIKKIDQVFQKNQKKVNHNEDKNKRKNGSNRSKIIYNKNVIINTNITHMNNRIFELNKQAYEINDNNGKPMNNKKSRYSPYNKPQQIRKDTIINKKTSLQNENEIGKSFHLGQQDDCKMTSSQ